jgi:hypothetical protein
VVIYRDGALIRRRWRAQMQAGRNVVLIAPAVASLIRGSAWLASLSGSMQAFVLRIDEHPDFAEWAGNATGVVIASHGEEQLMEAGYASGGFAWRVDYNLTLAPDRRRGELRGELIIDNQTDLKLRNAAVQLADAGIAEAPRPRQLRPPAADARIEPVALPRRMPIAPGKTTHALVPRDRSHSVPVESRILYDPLGAELDHQQRTPIKHRAYGTEKDSRAQGAGAAREYLEITTLERLPPGLIRVREPARSGRHVVEQKRPALWSGERLGVVLEATDAVSGERRQSDFFYDPGGRRLVEEIRVRLRSRIDAPVSVVVREHLYRGLNWTIAYNNGVGDPRKDGAQALRFDVTLPARGTTLIVYRVVYTW